MNIILSPINTATTLSAWRQKWIKVVNGIPTKEYFVTWHNSREEADSFVGEYFQKFGNKLPGTYYRPVEHANKKPYGNNLPKGEFISHRAITLA